MVLTLNNGSFLQSGFTTNIVVVAGVVIDPVTDSGKFGIDDPKKGTTDFLTSLLKMPLNPPVDTNSSSPSRIDNSK